MQLLDKEKNKMNKCGVTLRCFSSNKNDCMYYEPSITTKNKPICKWNGFGNCHHKEAQKSSLKQLLEVI